jgi:hypothetical protein
LSERSLDNRRTRTYPYRGRRATFGVQTSYKRTRFAESYSTTEVSILVANQLAEAFARATNTQVSFTIVVLFLFYLFKQGEPKSDTSIRRYIGVLAAGASHYFCFFGKSRIPFKWVQFVF